MMFLYELLALIVHTCHSAPLTFHKEGTETGASPTTHANITKRFFGQFSGYANENARPRDFMNEVIDHTVHKEHDHHPDRWMDFYNNGASWDHYVSPQLHSNSQANIHDPHYDVHLTYSDAFDETNKEAAQQARHIESYPGEIVSGENSLSKFVAPPVFDGPPENSESYGRNKIVDETKKLINSPESVATEQQNTKNLVDSLKSLMTPIKMPAEDNNLAEHAQSRDESQPSWDGSRIQNEVEDETKAAEAEARKNRYDFNYNDGSHHQTGDSREYRGPTDNRDSSFNSFHDEPGERGYKDLHDRQYNDDDNSKENGDSHYHHDDHINNFFDHPDYKGLDHSDFKDFDHLDMKGLDHSDFPSDNYIKNNEDIEKFHDIHDDNRDDFENTFHRHHHSDDDDDVYRNNGNSDHRGNIDSFDRDNFDNFENRDGFESENERGQGLRDKYEKFSDYDHFNNGDDEHNSPDDSGLSRQPIEMVQEESGKVRPFEGKNDLKAKHIYAKLNKNEGDAQTKSKQTHTKKDDNRATRKSEQSSQSTYIQTNQFLNATLPKL